MENRIFFSGFFFTFSYFLLGFMAFVDADKLQPNEITPI